MRHFTTKFRQLLAQLARYFLRATFLHSDLLYLGIGLFILRFFDLHFQDSDFKVAAQFYNCKICTNYNIVPIWQIIYEFLIFCNLHTCDNWFAIGAQYKQETSL